MALKVSRREFLRLGAVGAAAAVLAGCKSPRRWVDLEPYVRPPEEQLAGVATWYASTCRECPAGCGIIVRVMNGRALKVEGNAEHPLNRGKLCARGQAGLQLLYNPDRLAGPVVQPRRGSREFQPLSWEEALNTLYERLQEAGSGLAVWSGSAISGHLYDLFQRFTAAVGGPPPLVYDLYGEVNGYRAQSQAMQRLLGQANLPVYDLGRADVVLSFGADFLGPSWSQVRYGIEFGTFRSQELGKRGYLVQFEPRMSPTGAAADRWLPIRPGTEALVAQALGRIIADQGLGPAERAARARALAPAVDVAAAATAADLPVEELQRLAGLFAAAGRPLAIPGGALNGQSNAVEATSAVQMLNLIADTVDQPGGLSLPSPSLSGLLRPTYSSFADVQSLLQAMRDGQVHALFIHSTNPAYDLPEQAGFIDALAQVPLVVSFSPLVDETAAWADLVLPDRTYLESWGYEVVYPRFDLPIVGSQQPVVAPVFDARSAADVLLTVARGLPAVARALPWTDEVAFLEEMIAQLPAGTAGGSGAETLWARFLQHGGWWPASAPSSAPVTRMLPAQRPVSMPQFQGDESQYPYVLHLYPSALLSDGRGANRPWLQGSPDPLTTVAWQTWVEVHPSTAQALGLSDGDVVRVTSPYGEIAAPCYSYPAIRPDTVAIPLGQGHSEYGRYARQRGSSPLRLVGSQSGDTADHLAWAALRVRLARTGERVRLAAFENKVGVTQGFINEAFPGE